jgi:cytochrome c-type biogenesis protein CcmH
VRLPALLRRHPGLVPGSTVPQSPDKRLDRTAQTRGGARKKSGVTVVIGLALAILATPATADSNLPPAQLAYTQLPDPAQEARAKALMESLRCLVCQGQSIADSDAEMAGDMRALVRQRIAAGEQPEAIRAWLVQRYGDYVTYDPPWSWLTAPLWLMPIVLLAAGLLIARRSFGKEEAE